MLCIHSVLYFGCLSLVCVRIRIHVHVHVPIHARVCVCLCFVIITSLQVLCLYFEPTKKPSYTKARNVFFMCIFIVSMLFDILNRAYGNAKCANNSATSFSVHYKTDYIYAMLVCWCYVPCFFGWFILILDCWSWKSIENKKRRGRTRTQTSSIFTYNFLQFK